VTPVTDISGNTGRAVDAGHPSQLGMLLALNTLYIGFGTILGTVQGGLPPILRQQGHEIGAVGWIYAFYLPFGLAFLWAHYIDRIKLPLLGHRTGWIIAMQGIAVVAILLVASGAGFPVALLAGFGFAITFSMATMDTALDALAVEKVDPGKRGLASGMKLAALSIGAMIGNGAFVILFARYGWTTTFLLLAGFMVMLMVPILFIGETAGTRTGGTQAASLLRLLRLPDRRRRLLLVTVVTCALFPLAGLNRIMLLDVGVPLERIGWVVGTLGPVSMLIVSLVSMPLMARFGSAVAFLVFSVAACLSVAMLSLASLTDDGSLAIAGSILTGASVSGVYVALMTKILGWSAGDQPATDYAAYYGISRLSSTILTIAAAQIAGLVDWSTFYAAGALVLLAVLLSAHLIIFRSENG
jgi:PAT family beta-lactamase induction signal transducer AmpG